MLMNKTEKNIIGNVVYNEILMTYFAKKRGIFIHKSYNQISEHRLDGS